MNADHVLVAFDDSPQSEQAVAVAAQRVAGKPDAHVLLFHVLPTLPTELLEFGGRADHDEEHEGLVRLHDARVAWMRKGRAEAQPLYDRMTTLLREAGVRPEQIETAFDAPNPECSVAREILRAAQERSCGTVIVGYHCFPWHKELFRHHVGEELRRRAHEEQILVVGEACHV